MSHVPIRVSTLRGDQGIDFDVFVKINDKFILYCRKGDSFEGTRLTRLKEKKLKRMFILDSEENNYRQYLDRNIQMAFDQKSGKPLEIRTEIIQGAAQSKTEEVFENPDNVQGYQDAKDGALQFAEFLQKENQALGHILNMKNVDNNMAQHGVTVSSLAVSLAARLGVKESKQTQLLSLGALLHDFEHFHSGLIIARPLSQFSAEEQKVYREHPLAGARRLQEKKHFDQTVLNIISQHEEYIDGKGFPQGLTESKTDPLAVIVASANKVDRLLSFEGIPRADLGKTLMIKYTGCHPLEHLKHLSDIVNQFK